MDLKEKLQGLHYEQIIVLGDFNGVIDATLDGLCSTKKKTIRKILKSGLEDLVGVWRVWYGNKRDYTFFSLNEKSNS